MKQIILKQKNIRNNKGVSLAFFTMMLSVFIGTCCMVIDVSQTYSYKSRLKTACDLASLAGVSQLVSTSNVGDAKNAALNFLNNNLSSNLPGFTSLSQSSPNLVIQAGVYDPATAAFTWDETSPSVNAIKVAYLYPSASTLAEYFMINIINITGSAIASKQPANSASAGTSFPLVILDTTLSTSAATGNTTVLSQEGVDQNSYFSAYDGSSNQNDIKQIIYNFQSGSGTQPPSITVNNSYKIDVNPPDDIYSSLSESLLEGRTFVFPVGSISGNNTNIVGFAGATIDDIDTVAKTISITIIPGYIDNTFGGATITGNGDVGITEPVEVALLANSFLLVQ